MANLGAFSNLTALKGVAPLGDFHPQTNLTAINKTIEGTDGNDVINGGAGNDHLSGGSNGIDAISGGGGNDVITGPVSGHGQLYGGDGNDNITGGVYNDNIFGGSGDDYIYGGGGADHLYGGTGHDTFDFQKVAPINDLGMNGISTGTVAAGTAATIEDFDQADIIKVQGSYSFSPNSSQPPVGSYGITGSDGNYQVSFHSSDGFHEIVVHGADPTGHIAFY